MADVRITVTVEEDGVVEAWRRDTNEKSIRKPIPWGGLDEDLVRLFERWLMLRQREWDERELTAFGSLLHRCLFPERTWTWIEGVLRRAHGHRVRLELSFPAEGRYARLAAVPWEYLYRPDTSINKGAFLATEAELVLSRYIPLTQPPPAFNPADEIKVLVVVSDPDPERLGPVQYRDVLRTLSRRLNKAPFSILKILRNPTAAQMHAAAVAAGATSPGQPAPDLIHFMGHGEFDPERGEGKLALRKEKPDDDWVDWVPDRKLADLFTHGRIAPRAVVLHSCDAGKASVDDCFAGVAPQLVRSGVPCVVAMQYPVTNATAIAFSTSLYEQIGKGADLDIATQAARFAISRTAAGADTRLLGVPVVYLQTRTALLRRRPEDQP